MNYSEYSKDWKDIIRPSILKRDHYKCRKCGIPHKIRVYKNSRREYVECDDFIEAWAKNEGKKVFTLYLQVAHLDHDKSNNDPENLMTMCPRCHGKYDKEHKAFMKKVYTKSAQKSKISKKEAMDPMLFLRIWMKKRHNVTLSADDLQFIRTFVEDLLSIKSS